MDQLLFGPWVEAEIAGVDRATSKSGWNPIPEGYRMLQAVMPVETQCLAVDKSSWDWTCPWWVVKEYVKAKLEQVSDPPPGYFLAVWTRILYVLGPGCRVVWPDGTEIQQDDYGLMKSGFLLTLSLNSAAQDLQHSVVEMRAGSKPSLAPLTMGSVLWAMGDDSLVYLAVSPQPRFIEAYCAELATLGCIVKHAKVKREFAGFHVVDGCANPLYPDKHRFTLYYTRPEMVTNNIEAYSLVYACAHPDHGEWLDQERRRREMPSASYFAAWGKGLPVPVLEGAFRALI